MIFSLSLSLFLLIAVRNQYDDGGWCGAKLSRYDDLQVKCECASELYRDLIRDV